MDLLRARLLTFAVGFILLVGAAPAGAATITVNTFQDDQQQGDGQCSLRKAIEDVDSPGSTQRDCAPAAFGANTIVLRSGGPTGQGYTLGFPGALNIVSTVTDLTIVGAGESQTRVDGALADDRVFDIAPGASVTLRDLTVADGHAPNGSPGQPGQNGGGILNQGTLTMVDSGLAGDMAGGGSSGVTGLPASVGGSGGGIYNTGTLTLNGVTLSNDQAGGGGFGPSGQGGSGNAGGAGARGGDGGGVMNAGGSLTVENSTFRSNDAGSGGSGGFGGSASATTGGAGGPGGSGGGGGGIESDGGSLAVTNSTFASNFAGHGGPGGTGGDAPSTGGIGGVGGAGGPGGSGGGVHLMGTSPATLLQASFAGNDAGGGGAGGSGGSGAAPGAAGSAGNNGSGGGASAQGSSLTLENSLLALNGGGNCGPGILDGGHNLSFGDSSCPPAFATGNPNLGPLQDNGGPAPTIGLQSGSAAINQIPATGAGCPATDERGVKRPSGPACDIGAYEVAPPTATTRPASRVTRNSAFLNATVLPNQGAAGATFQYGRTSRYGAKTPTVSVGGVIPIGLTWRVRLKPNTTYHYRVVITTMDGTSYGADRTFTTTVGVIRHLKVSPSTFAQHATVTYTDTKSATTTFSVWRWRCFRRNVCAYRLYITKFTHHDRAGRNRLTLSTRIGRKRLGPGKYMLAATPQFRGNVGATTSVPFRVT